MVNDFLLFGRLLFCCGVSFDVHHRHVLLCPVCWRTHSSLLVHLRKVCMKEATPETICEVVEKAKQDAVQILRSVKMFSFCILHRIMEDAKPHSRCRAKAFLQHSRSAARRSDCGE